MFRVTLHYKSLQSEALSGGLQDGAGRGVSQQGPHRLAGGGAEGRVPASLRPPGRFGAQDAGVGFLDHVPAEQRQAQAADSARARVVLPEPGSPLTRTARAQVRRR